MTDSLAPPGTPPAATLWDVYPAALARATALRVLLFRLGVTDPALLDGPVLVRPDGTVAWAEMLAAVPDVRGG